MAAGCFTCSEEALDRLCRRDERFGKLVERYGILSRELTPEPFAALVGGIISQQISGKAAETVGQRFAALVGGVRPENVVRADRAAMQQCGMSHRKVEYICAAAQAALDGAVDFAALEQLDDAEIIRRLSALKGVGVWTAEMMLIFTFARPDVLSFHDFGIRRGLMRLHRLEQLDRSAFEIFRRRYTPYGTTASLYLWALAADGDKGLK
ncbi:DNA-3-methyladenine glycosylase [Victivallis sp. Marseille-Q1083]|uniref:DNA-3-methyladenine glycosylase family protein n=1 Tax=Victivallis sp. Marseille-Q1083 TaxID=2717288 RepID=UPI0015884451|nr:DNA-3-methyladenine glycosylase 2 family protein [Victivallis sp. Marseille-Q1083]